MKKLTCLFVSGIIVCSFLAGCKGHALCTCVNASAKKDTVYTLGAMSLSDAKTKCSGIQSLNPPDTCRANVEN